MNSKDIPYLINSIKNKSEFINNYEDLEKSNQGNINNLIDKPQHKGKSFSKLEVKNFDNSMAIKTNTFLDKGDSFKHNQQPFTSKLGTFDPKREFSEYKPRNTRPETVLGNRINNNEKLIQYSTSNTNLYKSNNIRVQTASSVSKRLTIKDL